VTSQADSQQKAQVGTTKCVPITRGSQSLFAIMLSLLECLPEQEATYGEAQETCGDLAVDSENTSAGERSHHRKAANNGEASRYFKTANDRKAADKRESSSRCEAPTGCY
jgi:hypothetical protein